MQISQHWYRIKREKQSNKCLHLKHKQGVKLKTLKSQKQFKRIYVEITNVCNLNCSFCPPLGRTPAYLSVNDFERIVKEIVPYTDYIYLHIKGEPLLHPQLESILDICYRHQLHVNITTNGTLLYKARDILYHAPALRQINISLHSFEQDSTTIGTHALEKLEHYISTILSSARYLSDYTDTITALRLWNLNKSDMDNDLVQVNTYIINRLIQEFPDSELASTTQATMTRGIKLSNQIYLNFDYEFLWPSLDAPYVGDIGSCYGLRTQLGVLVDGSVVPCCLDGDGTIILGNVLQDQLSNILTSPRVMDISQGFINGKITEQFCQHCGYRSRFSI